MKRSPRFYVQAIRAIVATETCSADTAVVEFARQTTLAATRLARHLADKFASIHAARVAAPVLVRRDAPSAS